MKTKPTDLDREAASLFTPAPGMRVWTRHAQGRLVDYDGHYGTVTGEGSWEAMAVVRALGANNPATTGCFVDQIEALHPCQSVTVVDRLHVLPGEVERRFMVLVGSADCETATTGPTRGAALVAAMRALKGKP